VQVWNTEGTEVTIIAMGSKHGDSTADDTMNMPFTTFAPGAAPAAGASAEDRMDFLHRQLNSLKDERLLDRFVLVGPQGRRQGGTHHLLSGVKDADDTSAVQPVIASRRDCKVVLTLGLVVAVLLCRPPSTPLPALFLNRFSLYAWSRAGEPVVQRS
jgi:hypothetical protein